MPTETHEFEAPITHRSFDSYDYTIVFLPAGVQESVRFPNGKPLRVDAEVNGVPLSGALMPHRGKRYLLLSKKFLKRIRSEAGDRVFVRFTVADQDAVDIPPELLRALEANGKARWAWDKLTPGKQRGHAYRVASVKREETRQRRIEEVLGLLVE